MRCIIIYAKPGLEEGCLYNVKHHSKAYYLPFLIKTKHCDLLFSDRNICKVLKLMWSTEHEEEWIFEVARSLESLYIAVFIFEC